MGIQAFDPPGIPPISERVMAWVEGRLALITKASGFETDIGLHVSRARRTFDPSELPAVTVFETAEAPTGGSATDDNASMSIRHGFSVIAHVIADQDDTGRLLGGARADIKRALLSSDDAGVSGVHDQHGEIGPIFYLGSDAEPRQDGADLESVNVRFAVPYKEGFGDPFHDL